MRRDRDFVENSVSTESPGNINAHLEGKHQMASVGRPDVLITKLDLPLSVGRSVIKLPFVSQLDFPPSRLFPGGKHISIITQGIDDADNFDFCDETSSSRTQHFGLVIGLDDFGGHGISFL